MSDAWSMAWAGIDQIDAPAGGPAIDQEANDPADPEVAGIRLESRIALGGTGTVYRARLEDGTSVAVKVAARGACQRASWALFLQERWLLDRLDHPGIVRAVNDGRTTDGRPWIATEMVAGDAVDVACSRRESADGERIQLVMQVLDALEHAHANGVVHRDIKPSNVIVDHEGSATLIDFGSALDLWGGDPEFGCLVESGNVVGTLGCISPEQADPAIGPIGPTVDVYQAALLLYVLLTGELPYPGRPIHPAAVVRAALSPLRVSAAKRRPELGGPVSAILDRALDREPGRRHASARNLCLELMDAHCVIA
jgi:serine/threonine protein kinase